MVFFLQKAMATQSTSLTQTYPSGPTFHTNNLRSKEPDVRPSEMFEGNTQMWRLQSYNVTWHLTMCQSPIHPILPA